MSKILENQMKVKDAKLFINGEYTDAISGETFDTIDPSTNRKLASVANANERDVQRAIEVAQRTFESGVWSDMPVEERAKILCRMSDLVMERVEELALVETMDVGKPIKESRGFDIPRAASNLRFFAEMAKYINYEHYDQSKHMSYSKYAPAGVTSLIIPWNLPFMQMTWKASAALAAGNTVVVKPASYTPLSAVMLGEIANEAGLPPGVLNIITGPGRTVGTAMTTHPYVRRISFVGETTTGKTVMKNAASQLIPVSLELGGKSANIVFEDADLDEAVKGSIEAIFRNQGEICLAGSRLLVQEKIYDKFLENFIDNVKKIKVGNPLDEDTDMGALVSRSHLETIENYVQIGISEGAKLAIGGKRVEGLAEGNFYEPTVFYDVENKMRIAQEEIFGPVLVVIPFKTEEEAVKIANDSMYGLAGVVWTNDLRRAHRVASRVTSGLLWINCWYHRDLRTPFGGSKASGIGREGGRHSFEFYTEAKTITMKL
ncbi:MULTISPECIES: aldehyde dehydrogenase [Aneurinibacillus]|uniref:Aldehyde dehydrogenase n=1 Tax=Aneurinibacillus thermoaerophilus TaxID=143495 RepID=A0A1G8DWB0_ANETH|nr:MULTISPECIES: aldehyde dehydrogenase [Aneurinibacillus]AMA73457.1 2-hydroxymuconic semialdehyde dehydrogenase [Aneurinibacillus sp. XH2]MED0680368.1 aldehyde dehydrogenase [Aneurinibacillus thermoaerophilus]MED0738508.1 aldehyde dehydrogenase [Aneurinibacillus thermoaerophilus]MED0757062.1 aldehyde dehydrogenase [Aneurinibacillus thermoaerophilus]MED0760454.1 aldehyde dehydrogenase [Aneurinibacillus thermoaerophilus]